MSSRLKMAVYCAYHQTNQTYVEALLRHLTMDRDELKRRYQWWVQAMGWSRRRINPNDY